AALALVSGNSLTQAVKIGTGAGVQAAAAQGGNLSAATAQQYATIGANTFLANNGNAAAVAGQAANLATNEYTRTQRFFEELPTDIKMFGLSFNTQVQ